jgi:hypothetical protein
MLNFENRDPTSESKYQIHEKKLTKNVLVELERLLIYANIPVSENIYIYIFIYFYLVLLNLI